MHDIGLQLLGVRDDSQAPHYSDRRHKPQSRDCGLYILSTLHATDRPTFDDEPDVVRQLSDGVLEETRVDAGVGDHDALDDDAVAGRRGGGHSRRPTELLAVLEPRQRRRRDPGRLARQLNRRALALDHEPRRHGAQLRRR